MRRLFHRIAGPGAWILGLALGPGRAGAQDPGDPFAAYPALFKTPLHYICYSTSDSMIIDGKADERVWKQAPWTADFSDIEGDLRPKPTLRTRAQLLWDRHYLYIHAELEEPELQGGLLQHDTLIFKDNDFEVFLNPENTTHNYFELEFNALGTVMDLFMFRPYRDGGKALMSWDAQGMRSAVSRRGTLNHPGDKDGGWSVEMAIPLSDLRFFGEQPPRDSSLWRINFSRVEWDWDVKEGRYSKRVDPASGRPLPEHNWVWSPQGIVPERTVGPLAESQTLAGSERRGKFVLEPEAPTMHAPERWGYLQFSARPVGSETVDFAVPAEEKARDYLWLIYYKQRDYRRAHGSYALKLEDLGFRVMDSGVDVTLESVATQYRATVMGSGFNGKLTIDQDGSIERKR